MKTWLRILAILELLGGIVGGILHLITQAEVHLNQWGGVDWREYHFVVPIAIAFSSVVGCTLFFALASALEALERIENQTGRVTAPDEPIAEPTRLES